MGLIHATRGSARIFGLDCDRDAVAVKRKVGYCPGELPQFGGWRGSEIVAYVAGLRGDVKDAAITALATRLDPISSSTRVRTWQQQKAGARLASCTSPLVILDEPTTDSTRCIAGVLRIVRTADRWRDDLHLLPVYPRSSTSSIASSSCARTPRDGHALGILSECAHSA